MIRLVMFDLDGVLLDACDWHYEALNRALKEVAGQEIYRAEHKSTFNGIPTRKKLLILEEQGRVKKEQFEDIFNKKQFYTKEVIQEQAKPDGLKVPMLQYLSDHGVLTACVTNSITDTTNLMLTKIDVLDKLNYVVTNEMVRFPKPNAEGYILPLVAFQVYPDEAIIVEDSPKGLQAAYATGCHVIEVEDATKVSMDLFKGVI